MTAMSLVYPTDHASLDVWGALVNAALTTIESHTHAPGLGNLVPVAGLSFNADLAAGTNSITGLKAVDFTAVATSAVTTYAGALFLNSADSELYYRTTGGTNVKVTSGSTLNVAAFAAGIGGDYASVSALFSFDDASDSYWAQQQGAPRPWAGIRLGNLDIYEQAVSITNRVRLQSPAALAASYAWTFPAALPGSTLPLLISSAGVMTTIATIASAWTATDFRYTTAQAIRFGGYEFIEATAGTHVRYQAASGANVAWTLAASAIVLSLPLPVRDGDTIDYYKVYINKITNAAVTLSSQIYRTRGSTTPGAETTVTGGAGTETTSLNAPGFIVLTATSIGHVVAAGYQYYLVFKPSAVNGTDVLYGADLGVTRP